MNSPATILQERKPSGETDERPSRRSEFVLLFLGLGFLCFVLGAAVAEFHWFPYRQLLRPPFEAGHAVYRRLHVTSSLRETDLWHSTDVPRRGVVRFDPQRAFKGDTLYTSGHASAAFLVDMDGQVKHQWHVPFQQVWKRPPHIDNPVPEEFVHWRRAHLFPNGDLLALYEAAGDTPWGYGLIKVDRESKLLWAFADRVHHDLCVDEDQSILTLVHAWRDTRSDPVPGCNHLSRTLLEDFVVRLSRDGEVLQRVSVLDAIANSEFRDLLATVTADEWDLLHTNTVKVVTTEFARQHSFLRAGQILISSRSRHALAVLDLDSERIVWASCGPYRSQHDPDLLANGQILLFDNRGHVGVGGPSRILEMDPVTQAISWCYSGTAEDPLYSLVRSCQQQLPNGNVLITESDRGRLLEITRGGEIVWEYLNPAMLDGDAKTIAILCGATRITFDPFPTKLSKNEPSLVLPGEKQK